METKQIILETRTDEDVIEITLAMIDKTGLTVTFISRFGNMPW